MSHSKDALIRVSVSFGKDGTKYGCGHALDTFLTAYGLYTEERLHQDTTDSLYESIGQTLKDYDWEAYALARLNDTQADGERAEAVASSDYLYGDWLRFNERGEFDRLAKAWREELSALALGSINDWDGLALPADLIAELKRNAEFQDSYARDEWLNGDRWTPGVLDLLAIEMFGTYSETETEWDAVNDTMELAATKEQWREFYGYDLDERDTLPDASAIAEYVRGVVLYKAGQQADKEARARAKRIEARAEAEKRRTDIVEAEKEAARQRRLKKSQA